MNPEVQWIIKEVGPDNISDEAWRCLKWNTFKQIFGKVEECLRSLQMSDTDFKNKGDEQKYDNCRNIK